MRLPTWVFLIGVLFSAVGPVAAQPLLWSRVTIDAVDLTPRQAEILATLRAEPGVTAVEVVAAEPSALDADRVVVELPGGSALVRASESSERRSGGSVSWAGRAEGDFRAVPLTAMALFVVRGGAITGTVHDGAVTDTIRPLTGGLHAVARVDTDALRPHGDDYEAFEESERARAKDEGRTWPQSSPRPAPASPEQFGGVTAVDVLVAYTAEVAVAYADPVALAQLSLDTAKQTFEASNMPLRFALVSAYETPTVASDTMNVDLSAFRDIGDGRFDEVHARRTAYGADLVALLGKDYPVGGCGVGYVDVGQNNAFSVTNYTCAGAGYTVAHELGHNFGATHDPYVVDTPAYAYGQGCADLAGRWRTVMAYSTECSDSGVSCPTVGYWSSPSVVYTDTTEPVHSGPTGDAAERDNRRVLIERAPAVAAFRATAPAAVAVVSPSPLAVTLALGATATRAVTIRNAAAGGASPLDWQALIVGDAAECMGPTDLVQSESSYYVVSDAGSDEYGQTFTAPCTGLLRTVAPRVYAPGAANAPWAGTMRVYSGAGTAGAVLGSRAASGTTPASGASYLGVTLDIPVSTQRGTVYSWFLDLTSGRLPVLYDDTNIYAGGTRLETGDGTPAAATAQPTDDAAFRLTFDEPRRFALLSADSGVNIAPGSAETVPISFSAEGLAPGTYTLTLAVTTSDPAAPAIDVPIALTVSGATSDAPDAAAALTLDAPRPNPTAASAVVPYTFADAGAVRLHIVDALGRNVADSEQAAGAHTATVDVRGLAPGVYVIQLAEAGQVLTRRLVVVR